ncbi:glycine-rich domain-containing protein [Serratia fonticola]
MAKNEFLPFGIGVNANVLTNDEYQALPGRASGFVSGVAKSKDFNKTWRQASVIASVVAQFIADNSGKDVLDNGDTATLKNNLEAALSSQASGRLLRTSIYTNVGGVQYVSVNGGSATTANAKQFTALSNTSFVEIECQGAGSGGGGVSANGVNPAVAGGGGAGAYGMGRYTSGFTTMPITVGEGGKGGAAGNNYGLVGGASSAGNLISCLGGYTGAGGSPLTPPFINGGGQVSDDSTGANLLKINGGNGNYGIAIGGLNAAGGSGGASKFGTGGPSTSNRPGYAAKNYGAGGAGAGAYSTSNTGFPGGDGSPGIVIIREYS